MSTFTQKILWAENINAMEKWLDNLKFKADYADKLSEIKQETDFDQAMKLLDDLDVIVSQRLGLPASDWCT